MVYITTVHPTLQDGPIGDQNPQLTVRKVRYQARVQQRLGHFLGVCSLPPVPKGQTSARPPPVPTEQPRAESARLLPVPTEQRR